MEKILYKRCLVLKSKSIYSSQITNSKKRYHAPPKYSKEKFVDWCLNSKEFNYFFKKWVKSNFEKDLAPSIDRKDDSKGYSFDNIQVMTWKENNEKYKKSSLNCKNNKRNKIVLQLDLNGNLIKEFHSLSEASRKLNINQSGISCCCNNKSNTAGGYKWKFK